MIVSKARPGASQPGALFIMNASAAPRCMIVYPISLRRPGEEVNPRYAPRSDREHPASKPASGASQTSTRNKIRALAANIALRNAATAPLIVYATAPSASAVTPAYRMLGRRAQPG